MLQIHNRIYVSIDDETLSNLTRENCTLFNAEDFISAKSKQPLRFSDVDHFCASLQSFVETASPDSPIIVATAKLSSEDSLARMCILLGGYMIWNMGIELDNVSRVFRRVFDRIIEKEKAFSSKLSTIVDHWQSLHTAVRLGWLVPAASDQEPLLDAEEFEHYAGRANGSVHMVAPGMLYLFPTPDDLPDEAEWAVCVGEDGGAVRRFSARYYGRLFADLGVGAAGCLGRTAGAAGAADRKSTRLNSSHSK